MVRALKDAAGLQPAIDHASRSERMRTSFIIRWERFVGVCFDELAIVQIVLVFDAKEPLPNA